MTHPWIGWSIAGIAALQALSSVPYNQSGTTRIVSLGFAAVSAFGAYYLITGL